MGRILLLLILFSLLLASAWWGEESSGRDQGEELLVLADRFLYHARNRDLEGARESLERIKAMLGEMPPYRFTDEEAAQLVKETVLLTEKRLSSGTGGEEFWLDSLSLYYLLDSATHPVQPLWLASLERWVKGWSEAGLEERLRQYQVLRPAMMASLDEETVQELDRLVSRPQLTGGQLEAWLGKAKAEQEEGRKDRSLQTLLLVSLAIAAPLGYVTWRKRRMSALNREAGAYSHPE